VDQSLFRRVCHRVVKPLGISCLWHLFCSRGDVQNQCCSLLVLFKGLADVFAVLFDCFFQVTFLRVKFVECPDKLVESSSGSKKKKKKNVVNEIEIISAEVSHTLHLEYTTRTILQYQRRESDQQMKQRSKPARVGHSQNIHFS